MGLGKVYLGGFLLQGKAFTMHGFCKKISVVMVINHCWSCNLGAGGKLEEEFCVGIWVSCAILVRSSLLSTMYFAKAYHLQSQIISMPVNPVPPHG
eukprot:15367199-Ditylum_brightwellii.AAC.2